MLFERVKKKQTVNIRLEPSPRKRFLECDRFTPFDLLAAFTQNILQGLASRGQQPLEVRVILPDRCLRQSDSSGMYADSYLKYPGPTNSSPAGVRHCGSHGMPITATR
jgi:hypothetical protein